MKKALYILTAISLVWLSVSCEDTSGSYAPTWRGFTYEPSTVHPGDSVTITAVQKSKGHYLNGVDYNFSMRVYVEVDNVTQDSTLSYSYHTNYDGDGQKDPQWRLKIPDNTVPGSYSCSFSARWNNSSDGDLGTVVSGNEAGYTGTISTTSYTLYTTASGSFTLPIAAR